MAFSHFIGTDFSTRTGKFNKLNLGYWIGGQYFIDAQGNGSFVIMPIKITGQRKAVVLDI